MAIKFSLKERVNSFKYAFNGIKILFTSECNVWIHAFMTILVLFLAIFFQVTAVEWVLLLFAIAQVFVAEAFNTVAEHICNYLTLEKSSAIKKIKDIAAGAVLIAAIFSAIIGLIIFIPYLVTLF